MAFFHLKVNIHILSRVSEAVHTLLGNKGNVSSLYKEEMKNREEEFSYTCKSNVILLSDLLVYDRL